MERLSSSNFLCNLSSVSLSACRRAFSPIEDDVEFVRALQKQRILTVPGRGFGGPGYIRVAFCVDDDTITRAMDGFVETMKEYR